MPIPGDYTIHATDVTRLSGWVPNVEPNPVPTIDELFPSTSGPLAGDLIVHVYGSGFVAGSVVRWNGADRATVFLSPGQVYCTVLQADCATPGVVPVTVFSPAPGGGLSAPESFTVTP